MMSKLPAQGLRVTVLGNEAKADGAGDRGGPEHLER